MYFKVGLMDQNQCTHSRCLSYCDRVKMFGITRTLSTRRLKYDLITVYKSLYNFIGLDINDFF